KFLDADTAKLYHNEELVEKSYKPGGNNFRVLIPHINGKGHTELKTTKYISVEAANGHIGNLSYEAVSTATSVRYDGTPEPTVVEPSQMKLDSAAMVQVQDTLESNTQQSQSDSMAAKIKRAQSLGFTGDMCTT